MAKIDELYDFVDSLTFTNMYDKRDNPIRKERYLSYYGNCDADERIYVHIYDTHMFIEKQVILSRTQPITETVNRDTQEGEAVVQRFIKLLTYKYETDEIGKITRGSFSGYRGKPTTIQNPDGVYNLIGSRDFYLTEFKDFDRPDEYMFYNLYSLSTGETINIDIYSDHMDLAKYIKYNPKFDYRETVSCKETNGAKTIKKFMAALSKRQKHIVYGEYVQQEKTK